MFIIAKYHLIKYLQLIIYYSSSQRPLLAPSTLHFAIGLTEIVSLFCGVRFCLSVFAGLILYFCRMVSQHGPQ